MTEKLTLAERIVDARTGAGLTMEEAALHVGVKPATFAKWESGATAPRANRLQMLCGILNVPLIWLLEGRNDLDPLDQWADSFEQMKQRLGRIKSLFGELGDEISMLEDEIRTEQDRSDNLNAIAEEAIPAGCD